MRDFHEAFGIFLIYAPELKYPTGCEHDMLYVYVEPKVVTERHKTRLAELGFRAEDGWFSSTRFGSA